MCFKNFLNIRCLVIGILCSFVLFSVSGVSGTIDFNAPEGELLYSYYVSEAISDTVDVGNNNPHHDTCPINGFYFEDIDLVDKIYWMKFHLECGFGHATEERMSEQTNFVITCSGNTVASGLSILQFEEGDIYLYFNGDVVNHGLTGYQACSISGMCPDSANYSGSHLCMGADAGNWHAIGASMEAALDDRYFGLGDISGGVNHFIMDNTIDVTWGSYWANVLTWETESLYGHDFTYVNVTRVDSGNVYESSIYVDAGTESYSHVDGLINVSYLIYSRPIDVSINDTLSMWHNCSLFPGAVGESYIFGYVRDAECGYLLSGVDVSLVVDSAYYNFETGGDGKYIFSDLEFGEGLLNATKDNYENFSIAITLVDGGRYDISLAGNVTVYDGTATVYGFARDYDTMGLIGNVLVRIEGNETDLSTYTNEYGFFSFYNVTGVGVHEVTGQKSGYESCVTSVNVSALDAKYSCSLLLLNESSVTTPAPDEEEGPYNPIAVLLDALGLGEFFDWIMALIIIAVLASLLAYLTHGSALATAIGAFFGFLISCFAGFLPMWLLAIAIMGACAFFAKMVMGR